MCLRFPSLDDFKAEAWAQKALNDGRHEGSALHVTGCSDAMSPRLKSVYHYKHDVQRWIHSGNSSLQCGFGAERGMKNESD